MTMRFKNNLKKLRMQQNMTQVELAEKLSIGQAEYSRIESGKRKIYPHKDKIAEILAVGLDDIKEVTEDGESVERAPVPQDLPVYGFPTPSGRGFQFTQQMMSKVGRPEELAGVEGAYACFCFGDQLEPTIKNGDLAFVNPNLEPRQGSLVVVRIESGNGQKGLLAKLVTLYKVGCTVQMLNPFDEIALGKEVVSVEPVVMVKYAM